MTIMPQLGFTSIQKGTVSVKGKQLIDTGVFIVVGIVGEVKGNVVYFMNLEHAKSIASTMMMGMPVAEFDDMAQSAVSELANMLTATAATIFSNVGITVDISTPTMLYGNEVSVKMNASRVICVEMNAEQHPFHINISLE